MALSDIPQSGLGAIQSGKSYVDSLANRYVVKPKTVKGIAGFVFDYEGETSILRDSEITNHYTENNTPLHDHVAAKPVVITLRGFVAELSQLAPQGVMGALSTIQNKLSIVPAYLGKYTPQAVQQMAAAVTKAQTVVTQIDQAMARAKNIVGLIPGAAGAAVTKQAQAYLQLEALGWPDTPLPITVPLQPQLFVVETPYRVFDNMVLRTLRAVQDDTTKQVTDITVTLMQMRFSGVAILPPAAQNNGGRAALQRQTVTDKGKVPGTPASTSLLQTIFNKVLGR
jgi:hypothetical protein